MTSQALPRPALALALILLAVRLCLAARLELSFDEAYYWTWARHPALSYLDHPPMVAWFIRLGTAIAGDTELGVRLLGPFSLFATTLLAMGTVRDLGGGALAMTLAGLFSELTVAAQAVSVVMTPDTPLLLFTAVTLRLLAAIVAGGPPYLWLAVGFAGGLALLSKYTAVMLAVGIGLWLVAIPARRRLLASPFPWAGAALAAAMFSPVLIWNAEHSWASFTKQGGRTLEPFRPSLATFVDFIGGQLGLLTPLIAGCVAYGLIAMTKESLSERADRPVLLIALGLPLLFYLTIYSIGGHVEGNWTLLALPPSLIAGALIVAERWNVRHVRRFALASFGLGALLSGALLLYLFTPFNNDLGRRDITHRLSGHKAASAEIAAIARGQGLSMIATFDYGTTALLEFYNAAGAQVVPVTGRTRYVDRPILSTALSKLRSGPVLVVIETGREAEATALFRAVSVAGKVSRRHRGKVVESYTLLRASDFTGPL